MATCVERHTEADRLVGSGLDVHRGLRARGFTPQALRDRLHGTPDSSIAGESVDTGGEAKTFADTIRETVPGVLGERAEMLVALALVIQESDRFSGSDLLSEAA